MNGSAFDRVVRAFVVPGSRRGLLLTLAAAPLGFLCRSEAVAKKHGKNSKGTRRGECGRCKNGHCKIDADVCRNTFGGTSCMACDRKSLRCKATDGQACGPCQVCQFDICQGCSVEEQTACTEASFDCRQGANQQHCSCSCACGSDLDCQERCRQEYDGRAAACLSITPGCFLPCSEGGEVSCFPETLKQPGFCFCAV